MIKKTVNVKADYEPGELVTAKIRAMKPKRRTTREPSAATLERWLNDGGCEATDGCWVEPDGTCEHGCQSWLIVMGVI
jgi:hypothetical protein